MEVELGSRAPISTPEATRTTSIPSSTGVSAPTRNVSGRSRPAAMSQATSTIVCTAIPPIRLPAARPRFPRAAAETVIASSGRLPATARNSIPPSSSPRPSRATSASVVFERLVPATHVAPAPGRERQWAPACRAAGLDPVPRTYDLRHSFVSLLLAEGRQPVWIAQQAGHSLAVLLSTYAHLIEEYAERERVDPELEIAKVREMTVRLECVSATEERSAGLPAHEKSPASAGPFWDGSDGTRTRDLCL